MLTYVFYSFLICAFFLSRDILLGLADHSERKRQYEKAQQRKLNKESQK